MNASWGGGPVAVVEYAYSMNGEWIKVDNSEFTILGQFDRTAAGGQTEKNIPGYKVYDFKLPDALLNRDFRQGYPASCRLGLLISQSNTTNNQ